MNFKFLVVVGIVVIIIISAVVFNFLMSPSKPRATNTNTTVAVIAPKPLVAVNDITGDPIVYNGLEVESESQISEWVTRKSFKVSTARGGLFGGGGTPLLVINENEFTLPQSIYTTKLGLGEKVLVHMKGRVEILNKDQLEKALSVDFKSDEFINLDDNHLTSWTLGPVLLLNSVEKISTQ